MLEIISPESRVKFENGALETVTKEIYNYANSIKRSFYHIAKLLVKVEEERLFVDDGFMSVPEYAEKSFGFKKSLCYNLLNIGKLYTAENGAESNLPHTKSKDYTSSQLKVILPYDEEEVRELAEQEEITPYMSVRALKKRLKLLGGEEVEGEKLEALEEPQEAEEPGECPLLFNIYAYESENGEIVVETEGVIPEVIATAINAYMEGGEE